MKPNTPSGPNAPFALAVISLTTLISAPTPAQDSTMPGIIPYEAHVETLDNGLKIIAMPMEGTGLVAYWSIARVGSRDEVEAGRSGFAHFFEHMMFRGTENFPAARYNETLTTMGANGNAYTTDDLTAYHVSIVAEDLEQLMELESDRFRYLSYSEPEFETEAGAVYGEYRKSRTNPMYTLYEAMAGAAFHEHPYGHMVIGYEDDIAAMPTMYDYSKSFFSRYYRPDNVVLFIVGAVTPDSVMSLVQRYYGDWESGYVPPEIPVEPPQEEERRIEVTYDGRTLPYVWLAYKFDAFAPADTRWAAADLLAELAFGSTSEAYRRLVLEEQVVEFLAADTGLNRDPSLLDIYSRIKDPDRVDYVLEVIDDTIAQFQSEATDEERLDALKSRLKYAFLMGMDTPGSTAGRLARFVAVSGGLEDVETLYRTFETVTPDDVLEAARHYLDPSRRTVAILREQQ